METVHLHGVSEQDSDAPPEDILVQHDRYIVALVTQLVRGSSNVGHPDVLDLEIDEIVQQVRIKFYLALLSRRIDHPKAYVCGAQSRSTPAHQQISRPPTRLARRTEISKPVL